MIDHVSIGVGDLDQAADFYKNLLAILDYRMLVEKPGTVGFGKKYPDFWLNHRPGLVSAADDGNHICLRASSTQAVDAFYATALELGAHASGSPGLRPEYHETYYACFIRDADGHHIEVVTFVEG